MTLRSLAKLVERSFDPRYPIVLATDPSIRLFEHLAEISTRFCREAQSDAKL